MFCYLPCLFRCWSLPIFHQRSSVRSVWAFIHYVLSTGKSRWKRSWIFLRRLFSHSPQRDFTGFAWYPRSIGSNITTPIIGQAFLATRTICFLQYSAPIHFFIGSGCYGYSIPPPYWRCFVFCPCSFVFFWGQITLHCEHSTGNWYMRWPPVE